MLNLRFAGQYWDGESGFLYNIRRLLGVRRTKLTVSVLPLVRQPVEDSTAWLGRLASGTATCGLPLSADVVVTLEPAPLAAAPTVVQRAREWA